MPGRVNKLLVKRDCPAYSPSLEELPLAGSRALVFSGRPGLEAGLEVVHGRQVIEDAHTLSSLHYGCYIFSFKVSSLKKRNQKYAKVSLSGLDSSMSDGSPGSVCGGSKKRRCLAVSSPSDAPVHRSVFAPSVAFGQVPGPPVPSPVRNGVVGCGRGSGQQG